MIAKPVSVCLCVCNGRLFSGVSYWQSDGVASSHWIRLVLTVTIIVTTLTVILQGVTRKCPLLAEEFGIFS